MRLNRFSNKLLILSYHRVHAECEQIDTDEIDESQFRMHVDVFSKYFNVFKLSDAIGRLKSGSLPNRAICITFDDGYRDNFDVALPILTSRGVPATFFIASGYLNGGIMWNDIVSQSVMRYGGDYIDLRQYDLDKYPLRTAAEKRIAYKSMIQNLKYLPKQDRELRCQAICEQLQATLPTDLMMSPTEVLKLHKTGMEIGAHTQSHPILSVVADAEAKAEIVDSKIDLEHILQSTVSSFAYPNGRPGRDYQPRHVDMVREAGFDFAVSTLPGYVSSTFDPLQLGRFSVWHRSKPKLILRLLLNYFENNPTPFSS